MTKPDTQDTTAPLLPEEEDRMSDLPHGNPMHAGYGCEECKQSWKEWKPFIDPKEVPKGLRAGKFKKPKLGQRYNGKHKD